jgi:hypothetical protein
MTVEMDLSQFLQDHVHGRNDKNIYCNCIQEGHFYLVYPRHAAKAFPLCCWTVVLVCLARTQAYSFHALCIVAVYFLLLFLKEAKITHKI